jgi:hypothetical protein
MQNARFAARHLNAYPCLVRAALYDSSVVCRLFSSNEKVDDKLVVAAGFTALALELFLVSFRAFFGFSRGAEDTGCEEVFPRELRRRSGIVGAGKLCWPNQKARE